MMIKQGLAATVIIHLWWLLTTKKDYYHFERKISAKKTQQDKQIKVKDIINDAQCCRSLGIHMP